MIINVNSTDELKKLKLTLEERHIFPFFFFIRLLLYYGILGHGVFE